MIPRVAHFVFGLREQDQPFHFLRYVSLESCRRVLEPQTIYLHHNHLPWGPWWERICPHLTLVEVDDGDEVLAAEYLPHRVPAEYRYAHNGRAASMGTTAFAPARLIAGHPDPPPVKLITGGLTTGEIAALHRRGDCFVSLCRGEGWGPRCLRRKWLRQPRCDHGGWRSPRLPSCVTLPGRVRARSGD